MLLAGFMVQYEIEVNCLTGSDFKYSCDLLIKYPLEFLHVILHFNQLAMLQLNRHMDISELGSSSSAGHRVYRFRPELDLPHRILVLEFRRIDDSGEGATDSAHIIPLDGLLEKEDDMGV